MQPDPNDSLGPLDFGITDSLFLPDSARPSLLQTVSNPRDLLAIALLVFRGCSVAIFFGYELSQQILIALKILNSYLIAPRTRMGVVDNTSFTHMIGCTLLCREGEDDIDSSCGFCMSSHRNNLIYGQFLQVPTHAILIWKVLSSKSYSPVFEAECRAF
jgi:hypothetical protein